MRLTLLLPLRTFDYPVRRARKLDVGLQVRARRNALIASTALAQRRAELNEVEEVLAARSATAGTGQSVVRVFVETERANTASEART